MAGSSLVVLVADHTEDDDGRAGCEEGEPPDAEHGGKCTRPGQFRNERCTNGARKPVSANPRKERLAKTGDPTYVLRQLQTVERIDDVPAPSQVGNKDYGERGNTGRCWRPIIQGDTVLCVPCGSLRCPECRPYLRIGDTERLVAKTKGAQLYAVYWHGSRSYLRQKIRKAGGSYIFFPTDEGLLVVTTVPLARSERVEDAEDFIYRAFLAVPAGQRAMPSSDWHYSKPRNVLPDSPPENLESQKAPERHGCAVSWDEFVATTEEFGFRLHHISVDGRASHYWIEGLREADEETVEAWSRAIRRYRIDPHWNDLLTPDES